MFPQVKVRLCFYVAVFIQKYVQTSVCGLMGFFFQFSCVPLVYYQGNTIYTLRARPNGRYFPDDILKCIFWNGNVWIPLKSSLKFVPKGPINNIPELVQIMACRRPCDKPLSQPILASLLTHICVTWLQYIIDCDWYTTFRLGKCRQLLLLLRCVNWFWHSEAIWWNGVCVHIASYKGVWPVCT